MEANELMVGDYVLFNDAPYIVQEISAKGWIHLVDAESHLRMQMSTDYLLEQIQGIPLTSEILEHNGFEWLMSDSKFITYNHKELNIHAAQHKENGEWLICVGPTGSTKKRFVEVSCLKYVHEFQHALHLCGIVKDITL